MDNNLYRYPMTLKTDGFDANCCVVCNHTSVTNATVFNGLIDICEHSIARC